ncbi:MAG: hypothetical protein MUC97_17355 [Bernardetiaceae bacterium]|jgi:predicted DNA-binding transcriptional regulator YafY|nr:hypothetical protein [Bernardetiaceae bacterium]
MHFRTTKEHLERIDALIRRRATGTPDQLAQKLGICRATWFEWLEQLRTDLGLPIAYDPAAQTYYYTRPGRAACGFMEESLPQAIDGPTNHPKSFF